LVIKPVNVGGGAPLQAPEDFGLRAQIGGRRGHRGIKWRSATIALGNATPLAAGRAGPWRIELPRLQLSDAT
jgi:hypothetical protein